MKRPLQVCRTSAETLAALRDITDWAQEIWLAYAWASSDKGRAKHWKSLPLGKVTRAIIGVQFAQTEPDALNRLRNCGPGVLKIVKDTRGVFHPKVLIGLSGPHVRILLGSSNFTRGGFDGNTELNITLSGRITDLVLSEIIEFFDMQWDDPRAFEPETEFLKVYTDKYENRPRPENIWRDVRSNLQSAELDVGWNDFFALIQQHHLWAITNHDEVRVFDDDERGSYLQTVEQCQRYFHTNHSLASMPEDHRKFVAGTIRNESGYFGSMTPAGRFKHLILSNPKVISDALASIPLHGRVTDAAIMKYLTTVLDAPGVNFGGATRLLAMRRPDRFISLNKASRKKIKALFGLAPSRPPSYLELLHRVWAMPWCASKEPTKLRERRVWKARVALLDAIFYEPT